MSTSRSDQWNSPSESGAGVDRKHQTVAPVSLRSRDTDAPQLCPVCGCALVYPVDWRQVDAARWDLELRCPGCETVRTVSLDRQAMHTFNLLLYRGSEELDKEASRLAAARAQDDEERLSAFAAALGSDLILPMDF